MVKVLKLARLSGIRRMVFCLPAVKKAVVYLIVFHTGDSSSGGAALYESCHLTVWFSLSAMKKKVDYIV